MKKFFSFILVALMAITSVSAASAPTKKIKLGKAPALTVDASRVSASHIAKAKKIEGLDVFDCTIEVSDVAATSCNYAITPADLEANYLCSVVAKATYEERGEEAIIAALKSNMDYYIELYANYGMSLTYADFTSTGVYEGSKSSLDPDTEYVVLAYSIDTETGEATSSIKTEAFTTEAVEATQNVITVTYDAESNTVKITTTTAESYVLAMETMTEYNEYQEDMSDESILDETQSWVDTYDYYGVTDDFVFSGDQEIDAGEFWNYVTGDDIETGQYIFFVAPYAGVINGTVSYVVIDYTAPEIVPTGETKDIHIVSPKWNDAVADAGWWQISGYNADKTYYVSLSNNETEEAAGTYELEDMDKDYTMVITDIDSDDGYTTIKFASITVTVEEEDGVITVKANGLGKDGIEYNITFDPINTVVTAESEVDLAIVEPEFSDYVESQGWWQISGYTADYANFVGLSNDYTTELAGTYELADMDLTYSYIYTDIVSTTEYTQQEIYDMTAVVEVDGDFVNIKADILCKNNVLYHVTFEPFNTNAEATSVDSIVSNLSKVVKSVKNGHLEIIKNGVKYNEAGIMMK